MLGINAEASRLIIPPALFPFPRLHRHQGFGVTAQSTLDCRKLDPTAIVVYHQTDVGEYLRDEDTLI
jgi:hypothetical protein